MTPEVNGDIIDKPVYFFPSYDEHVKQGHT